MTGEIVDIHNEGLEHSRGVPMLVVVSGGSPNAQT